MVEQGADLGLAFDGDADRVLAVDADGRLVDGDQIIAIAAIDRHQRGLLAADTVVVTVMTNLGFRLGMADHGIEVLEVPVGDRNVLEAMAQDGLTLGGEQSGHVIFGDLSTTGDGLLTAVQLLDAVGRAGQPLAALADAAMTRLPQVLRNVRVDRTGADVSAALAARHRRRGGGARRPRARARSGQRHRATGAGDGGGSQLRSRRVGGRSAGRSRRGPRGRPDAPVACAPCAASSPSSAGPASAAISPRPTSSVVSTRCGAALGGLDPIDAADSAAALLEELDGLLGSLDGIAVLVRNRELGTRVAACGSTVTDWVAKLEAGLDVDGDVGDHALEAANAAILRLKDAVWAVARDRLPTAAAVRELVGPEPSWSALEVGTSIQQALSALDRLEVRGRDSAGITVLVRDHGLDLQDPACGPLAGGPGRRPALPLQRRARGGGPPQLRLQGGRRDRRAGRQHRCHAG